MLRVGVGLLRWGRATEAALVTRGRTLAERAREGDRIAIEDVARRLVRVRPDNFVERPWGGNRLATYKGVALDAAIGAARYGEAFEIAADPTDPECAAHSSVAVLEDGSELALPALLGVASAAMLGAGFARVHGARLPILPKTLDVADLLSVQAHPAGLPELYFVIDADPGATLRLGFSRDLDLSELRMRLEAVVRRPTPEAVVETNAYVLGLLNELPVRGGDLIWNASVATRGAPVPSADVHALGNPERREMLILEVRLPGPTWRVWDHGRAPARPLHIAEALGALSPHASDAGNFRVTPQPLVGHAGVRRAVRCAAFTVDLLAVAGTATTLPDGGRAPRTLHVTSGAMALRGAQGLDLGVVQRGESVLIPASLVVTECAATAEPAEAVLVTLPGQSA
jgi:hypothetical protein